MTERPASPAGVRTVSETRRPGDVPLYPHPEWESLRWLVHGTTGQGDGFDLGLFGTVPVGESLARWGALRTATGMGRVVHARQVHGAAVRSHGCGDEGLCVSDGADGHVTERPGVLLTVSVADCVPVALVDPERRRVALLHAGWRGTAAGIVAAGLEALHAPPSTVLAHLGPAICGSCYEVGPEVHEALGLPVPPAARPVDLRAVQARQLVDRGVPADRITMSAHCTRCGDGFYSHRGGSRGRQVGYLGLR